LSRHVPGAVWLGALPARHPRADKKAHISADAHQPEDTIVLEPMERAHLSGIGLWVEADL